MSTLLQLVNFARQESGVLGADLTSLTGVTGESLRFKNWIIRAWEEIQELRPDWKWMRSTYSFTTTADDGSYTSTQAGIASRFGWWDRTYCTVYLTASGTNDQTELCWMEYEDFRAHYLTGTQTSNRPRHFTIGLSNELLIGPEPESTLYTITGQYVKSPQTLSADADEPELPEQHKFIAWWAINEYGGYEVATEALMRARSKIPRMRADLEAKYLPTIQLDGPLT
jgi:hypothetical protein